MSRKNSEERYSTTELKDRGWTDELMDLLLPDPLERRNYYGVNCRYYLKSAVHEMEQTSEFMNQFTRKQLRKEKRESLIVQRINSMQTSFEDLAETMVVESNNRLERLMVGYLHLAFVGTFQMEDYDAKGKESTTKHIKETMDQLLNAQVNRDKDCIVLLRKMRWLVSMFFKNKAKKNREEFLCFQENYPKLLLACARMELQTVDCHTKVQHIGDFLTMPDFPFDQLMDKSVYQLYLMCYIPYTIKQDLSALMHVEPKDEYPQARMMHRKFIIHVGPTNSGKTYQSLQRLAKAKTGTYLGPLRLLALEVQEQMLDQGVKCSLMTGEEEDIIEGQTHIASTVEKVDLQKHFDVAVIDECQMIKDIDRGFAWTRAILGVQADEIHCCVAQEGLSILKSLIADCGDSYEIESTNRFTELEFSKNPVFRVKDLEPGDAVIAFSKKEVLRWAEVLRLNGKKASIIYGNLPYPARKMQMQRFLDGETQYIVATDAIGMGLNMPIRRVLFTSNRKFDGKMTRSLNDEEVRQIAGRAGRKGLYDCGFVGFLDDYGYDSYGYLHELKSKYYSEIIQIEHAYLGFTNLVLKVDHDTLDVLKVWAQMPTKSEMYRKTNISRYIEIISLIRSRRFGFSKEIELKCANVLFDERKEPLLELFLDYCDAMSKGLPLTAPVLSQKTTDALELYCKKLDLYYSFSKNFGYPVDMDWIREEKFKAAEKIHKLLIEGISIDSKGRAVRYSKKKNKKKKQGYRNQPASQRK